MDRRATWAKIVPVLLMLLIVVATSHFHADMEPGAVRCCRALAFTLLSFAWIYIVGVRAPHGIEYLKENSCQFVARLSPVLYVSAWIAAAFTISAVGGFAVQYMRMAAVEAAAASAPYQPIMMHASAQPSSDALVSIVVSNDGPSPAALLLAAAPPQSAPRKADEEEEELFRQARMQSLGNMMTAGRRMLEPIREN